MSDKYLTAQKLKEELKLYKEEYFKPIPKTYKALKDRALELNLPTNLSELVDPKNTSSKLSDANKAYIRQYLKLPNELFTNIFSKDGKLDYKKIETIINKPAGVDHKRWLDMLKNLELHIVEEKKAEEPKPTEKKTEKKAKEPKPKTEEKKTDRLTSLIDNWDDPYLGVIFTQNTPQTTIDNIQTTINRLVKKDSMIIPTELFGALDKNLYNKLVSSFAENTRKIYEGLSDIIKYLNEDAKIPKYDRDYFKNTKHLNASNIKLITKLFSTSNTILQDEKKTKEPKEKKTKEPKEKKVKEPKPAKAKATEKKKTKEEKKAEDTEMKEGIVNLGATGSIFIPLPKNTPGEKIFKKLEPEKQAELLKSVKEMNDNQQRLYGTQLFQYTGRKLNDKLINKYGIEQFLYYINYLGNYLPIMKYTGIAKNNILKSPVFKKDLLSPENYSKLISYATSN